MRQMRSPRMHFRKKSPSQSSRHGQGMTRSARIEQTGTAPMPHLRFFWRRRVSHILNVTARIIRRSTLHFFAALHVKSAYKAISKKPDERDTPRALRAQRPLRVRCGFVALNVRRRAKVFAPGNERREGRFRSETFSPGGSTMPEPSLSCPVCREQAIEIIVYVPTFQVCRCASYNARFTLNPTRTPLPDPITKRD